MASDKAAFALFARGGLKPLAESAAITIDVASPAPLPFASCKKLPWDWLSWYFRMGTHVGGSLPDGVHSLGDGEQAFASSSESLRDRFFPEWRSLGRMPAAGGGAVAIDPAHGVLTISTPCCAGGFAEHGDVCAAGVRAEISGGPAGVWAVSLDGKDLAKSGRILVCHVTDAQNEGAVFADGAMDVQLERGHSPMMMRFGKASVTLVCESANVKVFALADDGRRLREVPCRLENGALAFTADIAADPAAATIYYEVEMR